MARAGVRGVVIDRTARELVFGSPTRHRARPMAGGLGAIATRPHVAPATQSVLGAVEKHAMAARIGTAAHARELRVHQCVGRRLDDGDHQTGERIARGHESAHVPALRARVEAARSRAPAEYPVDFHNGIVADPLGEVPLFGQHAERGAHPSGVDQRGRGGGRLQHRTSANAGGALVVDRSRFLTPGEELYL